MLKNIINIKNKIKTKKAIIGIIGLGYVGYPLAINFAKKQFKVIGFDNDPKKIRKIKDGGKIFEHIKDKVKLKNFIPTSKFSHITSCDIILICVPTPLMIKKKLPDLSYIKRAVDSILPFLRKGQFISLESTSYPGTTEELIVKKIKKKFNIGKDIFVSFSPEREDPARSFKMTEIPKVISGSTKNCLVVSEIVYRSIFKHLHPVSSTKVAEFTKLLENIYRSVNIGLINEMKIISKIFKINIFEAIEAAKTKPFGFRSFLPGPGMGGHCIPIDPYYMSWKSKQLGYNPKFIENSGLINNNITKWILKNILKNLKKKFKKIKNLKVLIIGIAYKQNIGDDRESPAYPLIKGLVNKGVKVDYHDPYFPKKNILDNKDFYNSIKISEKNLKKYNAVVIVTDHQKIDYGKIYKFSRTIFDCRGKYSYKKKLNKVIYL